MTAPRKPVAWIREGAETVMHNVRLDEPSSGPWIALAPIADLQPLWALVEKWEAISKAHTSRLVREAHADFASELRATLEAMQ